MKIILHSIAFLLMVNMATAQKANVITQGEIVFEKTINVYAVLKKGIEKRSSAYKETFERYKQTQPQFLTLQARLAFNRQSSLYTPIEKIQSPELYYFGENPSYSQLNKVFNEFRKDSISIQKNILNETLLLRDKKRPIKWKLTDETREIAGYSCKRANGLVGDSIYLVAFYTNQIPVPGGPESFNNLPGMILGVAVPHQNITWFAKEVVEQQQIKISPNFPNTKRIDYLELQKKVEGILKANKTYSNSLLSMYIL